jgi:hypothetical protein
MVDQDTPPDGNAEGRGESSSSEAVHDRSDEPPAAEQANSPRGDQPGDSPPSTSCLEESSLKEPVRRLSLMVEALLGPKQRSGIRIPNLAKQEEIRARAKSLHEEVSNVRDGLRSWRTVLLVASFVIPVACGIAVYNSSSSQGTLIAGLLGFAELYVLLTLLFTRARLQDLNADLQVVEFDTVLYSLANTRERTAANLFFKHQLELKRYYDLTLRQHRQAFVLGVVCVLFGLGVVAGAAVLVATSAHDTTATTKVVTGALGAVGAFLAGFVAQVYLGIYRGSAVSLGSFHGRLVETNHLHFANLLLSGINNNKERYQALKDLASKAPAARAASTSDPNPESSARD